MGNTKTSGRLICSAPLLKDYEEIINKKREPPPTKPSRFLFEDIKKIFVLGKEFETLERDNDGNYFYISIEDGEYPAEKLGEILAEFANLFKNMKDVSVHHFCIDPYDPEDGHISFYLNKAVLKPKEVYEAELKEYEIKNAERLIKSCEQQIYMYNYHIKNTEKEMEKYVNTLNELIAKKDQNDV